LSAGVDLVLLFFPEDEREVVNLLEGDLDFDDVFESGGTETTFDDDDVKVADEVEKGVEDGKTLELSEELLRL
jgi:hypothetical protein